MDGLKTEGSSVRKFMDSSMPVGSGLEKLSSDQLVDVDMVPRKTHLEEHIYGVDVDSMLKKLFFPATVEKEYCKDLQSASLSVPTPIPDPWDSAYDLYMKTTQNRLS